MATTFARVCARGDTRAAVEYIHGTEGERPAAILSDLGATAGEVLMQVEGYLEGTRRKRAGLVGVHSFARDELDPAAPGSAQTAVEATYVLLRRHFGGDAPLHVVAHLDSESGLVHTHWLAVNHQVSTDKALRADWRTESLRRTNDTLMAEIGPPFRVPAPADRSLSPAEFYNPQAVETAADLRPDQLDGTTGKQWARERLAELVALPAVRSVEDLVTIAPDYGLSLHLRPATATAGPTLTVAVIGLDGEPLTSTDGRSRLAWTAKKLGAAFTYAALGDEIHRLRTLEAPAVKPPAPLPPRAPEPQVTAPKQTPRAPEPQVTAPKQTPRAPEPQVTAPKQTPRAPEPQVTAPSRVRRTPLDQHPPEFLAWLRTMKIREVYEAWHEKVPASLAAVDRAGMPPALDHLPDEALTWLKGPSSTWDCRPVELYIQNLEKLAAGRASVRDVRARAETTAPQAARDRGRDYGL